MSDRPSATRPTGQPAAGEAKMTSIYSGSLQGQLLVAMPNMGDPRFDRAVIYMCEHTPEQAMGLVINHPSESVSFSDLLQQFDISQPKNSNGIQIHMGGPLETTRGFVLHSADYVQRGSLIISETMALTANVDILRAIANNEGPHHSLLALGYASWGPSQLENEIMDNVWLHIEADEELVFCTEPSQKWLRAMSKLGIDVSLLSADVGHA